MLSENFLLFLSSLLGLALTLALIPFPNVNFDTIMVGQAKHDNNRGKKL